MQQDEGSLLDSEEDPIHLQLMQDSAPAPAVETTLEDLADRNITVIKWPPYSPDLNPIENCWNWMKDYLDHKWGDAKCSLATERDRILECWEKAVTDQRLEQLLRGLPERCGNCCRGWSNKVVIVLYRE